MTRLKYLCIWLKVVFSSYEFYLRPKHVIALGSRTLMFINDNKTMDDGSLHESTALTMSNIESRITRLQ